MKKRLLFYFLVLSPLLSLAQISRKPVQKFIYYRDSLIFLSNKMINDTLDTERKNANYSFIKTLVSTLKQPGSYNIKFDSVKSISVVNSPDSKFRIFSWHIMNDDGSYRFYGAIQMNTGNGKLSLFPLADYSPFIKNPQDTIVDNTQWYGAQYYSIVPVTDSKPYYILLGWKGNNVKVTKKVIDVLSFPDGKPVFGKPVFKGVSKTANRVVFEYSRQVSMILKYLRAQNMIVFDHLAPPAKGMAGQYDQYGPDLTYDAYVFSGGMWTYKKDIELRNTAGTGDDFSDPKTQAKRDRISAGTHRH